MKIVVPFLKENELLPKQYIRRFNNRPLFEYIILTLKSCNSFSFVIWTDIIEIKDFLFKNEINCRYISSKELNDQTQSEYIFLNPDLPFISNENLKCIWELYNQNNNIESISSKETCFAIRGNSINTINFKDTDSEKNFSISSTELERMTMNNRFDWWIAEKLFVKKKILIHPLSSSKLGTGHIFRGLTLASQFIIDHDVVFLFREDQHLGIHMVQAQGYKVLIYKDDFLEQITSYNPDIIINDLLNTSREYIKNLKDLGYRVINFEDMGEGAVLADAVINALYPGDVPQENFYTGEQYYCIREDFIGVPKKVLSKSVNNVLITYGGEDPQFLTKKTLLGLLDPQEKYQFTISVILGPAFIKHEELYKLIENLDLEGKVNVYEVVQDMANFIRKADIVFTSAGRTMYEIATIGTPAVVTAQNYRELTHTFGHPYNGFYNLGYCEEATIETYCATATKLIEDFDLRQLMHERMCRNDFSKGIERVKKIILGEMVNK